MRKSIRTMVSEIASVLNGQAHSVWLYGSVVLDDFRPGWSDIDFVAFTNRRLSRDQAERLLPLRQTLSDAFPSNPYYRCFEGVVMPLRPDPADADPNIVYWGTTGQRIVSRYALDPFARYELAVYGRSVYGASDRGIFRRPDRAEMVAAVRLHYESIRKCAVQTDERLYSCGWLLDIARCVYTLRYHDVIAKTRAGEWALAERVFPDEASLRRAVEIRKQPLNYRDREDVKRWLCGLGPVVQRYADVLENELQRCTGSAAL
jgi:predicted nucleotidyltransferase